MKVWDLRQLKQPLAALGNLPTNYATTACRFSPDARLLITGTAAEAGAGEGGGQVVFVDSADWSIVRRVGMPAHVAGLDWHPRINQIFVGIGRCCPLNSPIAWGTQLLHWQYWVQHCSQGSVEGQV
jgi:hypothetical protein